MIKCLQYQNVDEFLSRCESFMLQAESENNLILGLADAMAGKKREFSAPLHYALIRDHRVIGAALRTDAEKPLSVTRMPQGGIESLCEKILSQETDLAGVVGEADTAESFANLYSEKKGIQKKLSMHQGVYEASSLIMPDTSDFKIGVVSPDNRKIATKFIDGFIADCFPESSHLVDQTEKMVVRHLKNQTLYLLYNENGEACSMAANNRETRNTACVSLVYTPPEHRRKGYGSLVTALVSQKMLDSGKKYCNLFTDLTNPTSNSIYQKIGYKMIGKSKHFLFLIQ